MLQPGSTVATALTAGEAARKHAWLLEVMPDPSGASGVHFRTIKLPLATVRPFVYEAVRGPAPHYNTSPLWLGFRCLYLRRCADLPRRTVASFPHRLFYARSFGSLGLRDRKPNAAPCALLAPRASCLVCMLFLLGKVVCIWDQALSGYRTQRLVPARCSSRAADWCR